LDEAINLHLQVLGLGSFTNQLQQSVHVLGRHYLGRKHLRRNNAVYDGVTYLQERKQSIFAQKR